MKTLIVFLSILVSISRADLPLNPATEYNLKRAPQIDSLVDIEKKIHKTLEEQDALWAKTMEEAKVIKEINDAVETTRRQDLLTANALTSLDRKIENLIDRYSHDDIEILRKKLSEIGLDDLIQTKKGIGYYLKEGK